MNHVQILLNGQNKKTTINHKNDDKCFLYGINAALNYEQIKSHSEKTSKIKYNWKETDFLSHKNDWKMFEKNNKKYLLMSYMCLIILKK